MKTAIVPGGTQGIGKGITQALLTQGWRVAVLNEDSEAVRDISEEMPTDTLIAIRADVAREHDVEKAFEKIILWNDAAAELEGIDLLVSNAGLASPVNGPIEHLELKKWQAWQDNHVTGAFLMVCAAVPLLRQRKGAIVVMASRRAIQSEPDTEAYAAAQGALCAPTHVQVSSGVQKS